MGGGFRSSWQQDCYKDTIFATFQASQKDRSGVPSLNGDIIRSLARDQLGESSQRYSDIEESLEEVKSEWDEWRYCLKHIMKKSVQ
ncbi:MAG: hypothetical protein C0478_15660 [Planctomyces sp.]|nr:hypothetical protein [Planctomyces sp.]